MGLNRLYNMGTRKVTGQTIHNTHTKEVGDNPSILTMMMLDGSNMPIKFDNAGNPIEWEFIEGTQGN